MSYLVLRDTNEHKNKGWHFPAYDDCIGTESRNLYTGDYSIEGLYENKTFVIERKGAVSEFVANITQKEKWDDFKQELERLEEFKHPIVICEFPFSLLERYPVDSGVPRHLWDKIKVTPKFLIKRFFEIELNFKTKFLFTDNGGFSAAKSLMKRIVEKYGS